MAKQHPAVVSLAKTIETARKRREAMQALLDKGASKAEIGRQYGISRERVRQILSKKS